MRPGPIIPVLLLYELHFSAGKLTIRSDCGDRPLKEKGMAVFCELFGVKKEKYFA